MLKFDQKINKKHFITMLKFDLWLLYPGFTALRYGLVVMLCFSSRSSNFLKKWKFLAFIFRIFKIFSIIKESLLNNDLFILGKWMSDIMTLITSYYRDYGSRNSRSKTFFTKFGQWERRG